MLFLSVKVCFFCKIIFIKFVKKFMKYLLLPFTLIIWGFISYFAMWATFSGILIICQFSWLVLFFAFFILIGLVSLISFSLPALVKLLILKLYDNRVINILHAIAGLLGIICFGFYIFSQPIKDLISAIWQIGKWKMIINAFPFLGLFAASIINNLAFAKLDED